MKLNAFQYSLPGSLIAQKPLKKRDAARLLIVNRADQSITHDTFSNLARYLPQKSHLVLNDSKVVHARLLGRRATGAEVEIFLLKKLKDGYSYETLMRPLKRLKEGETVNLNNGSLKAIIVDRKNRIVRFQKKNISKELERYGHIPLPPYIKRNDTKNDKTFYQTVYAKRAGSVAAPTAGLHFTENTLKALIKEGHAIHKVTLHINYGTFKPVEVDNINKHKMHLEEYKMDHAVYESLQEAKSQGRKIIAVGTTSCRVLETVAAGGKFTGVTDKFIYPGYQFKIIDGLITNFHLPKSTLLMLVCAFGGYALIMKAYKEAIKERYRFYSYGDAMLVL